MKITHTFSNSLIQLTVLAQQICYNGHVTILSKYVNSTLTGGDKKKRTYVDPNTSFQVMAC